VHDAEDHRQETEGGDDLGEHVSTGGPVGARPVDGGELEHHVGGDGAEAATRDLRRDVRARGAAVDPRPEELGQGDGGVEVRARDGPEGEDERDECQDGGGRVLEELQPDVAG
jgi:hypothetical protein